MSRSSPTSAAGNVLVSGQKAMAASKTSILSHSVQRTHCPLTFYHLMVQVSFERVMRINPSGDMKKNVFI